VPSLFPALADPLREIYRQADASIGAIATHLGDAGALMVYTIDETGPNAMDLPSMALLPELLWRWSGMDAALYGAGGTSETPKRRQDYRDHWKDEVWALRTALGEETLRSPDALTAQGDPLNWHPAAWYREHWPRMRAFALPSVADGHIRINLEGREASGTVPFTQFAEEVARLEAMLAALVDPRTGRPAVERVIQTRDEAHGAPGIPPDLVVVWRADPPLDCLDHPALGRVGPAPYFRSGGHCGHGTPIENRYIFNPGGSAPREIEARDGPLGDLPATILALIGEPAPRPSLVSVSKPD
jgi:hypothetical protein